MRTNTRGAVLPDRWALRAAPRFTERCENMQTQKKDGLLQQDHPQTKESESIIPVSLEKVKAENPLRALRINAGVSAREMVEVVQTLYPKYDKTLQSKCENGEEYGVELKRDAMQALMDRFAQSSGSATSSARKDGHRYQCRLYCRLPDEQYGLLQRYIREEGYTTMQDWLSNMIDRFIEERKGQQNDSQP